LIFGVEPGFVRDWHRLVVERLVEERGQSDVRFERVADLTENQFRMNYG
jgi:hypothetical protein